MSAASSSSSSVECVARGGEAGTGSTRVTGSMGMSSAKWPLPVCERFCIPSHCVDSIEGCRRCYRLPKGTRAHARPAGHACECVRSPLCAAQMLRKKYVNQAVVLADSFDRRYSPITVDFPRVAPFFRCFAPLSHAPRVPVAGASG